MKIRKRDMNFANTSSHRAGERRKWPPLIWLPLLLTLMMGTCFVVLRVETLRLAGETREMTERMAAWRVSVGEMPDLLRTRQAFCENARRLQTAVEHLADTGVTGKMVRSSLELAGDSIYVSQVSAREGCLVLSARTGDYREAGLFAKRLRDSDLFQELDYEGFQRVENGYTFVVECVAAKEEQDETQ